MPTAGKVAMLLAGMLAAGWLVVAANRHAPRSNAAAMPSPAAAPACGVTNITVSNVEGGFVDECTTRACPSFKGTATLTNACTVPIGVRVKITAFDAQGRAIQTRELWPASTRNIAPGDYAFNMDTWLDPDERIERFSVDPVEVKTWR